jgi:acetylornithine deacetylase
MSDTMPKIQPQRLRQLLRRLIDIYSPSGKEGDIVDYLHGYLKRHGISVLRQPVEDKRHNLVVLPPEADSQLCFLGHVDTVAAHNLEKYGYGEQADRVIGLGASDMKGGCAAMVEAYLSLWELGLPRLPVALALVVGEEEDGDGAERLVKDFHFPWVIIGEPTDLRPCLSQYGYLEVELATKGKRMHASMANLARNPIEAMLHLILRMSQYLVEERPQAVYNIRDVFSAQAGFAVPDRCNAWLDVHLSPEAPIGDIMMELEGLLAKAQEEDPGLDATLRFDTIDSGYVLPEKGILVEALRSVYACHSLEWAPQPFPSHSDANQLWASGVKPILLGCGRIDEAHAPDESVSFQQVCLAAQLYLDLALRLSSS